MPIHIPTEVLEILIRFLLLQPSEDLSLRINTILRVCKRWHDIGARILWTDMVLGSAKQIAGFTRAPVSRNLTLTKTVTIAFAPLQAQVRPGISMGELVEDRELLEKHGNASTRGLTRNLKELCDIIPRMEQLSALSIQVGPSIKPKGPRGFRIPRQVLHQLVMSLPLSVQHLEIDTRGHEWVTPEDDNFHICAAIAARLSTLRSLRLRLSRVCSEMFAPSETLNSMAINMIEVNSMTKAYRCGEPTNPDPTESLAARQTRGKKTCKELVTAGLAAVSQMPNLREFLVVDAESYIESSLAVDMLHVRDVLHNKSTTFPSFSVECFGIRDGQRARRVLRKLPVDGIGEDIVGIISEIEIFAEGPAWCTTSTGTRLPSSIRKTIEGHRHSWVDEKAYMSRDELEHLPQVPNVDFWNMEAQAGRQLVQAKIQDGVADLDPLLRDTYEKPEDSDDSDSDSGASFSD